MQEFTFWYHENEKISFLQQKSKFVWHKLKIQESYFLKNRGFLTGTNYARRFQTLAKVSLLIIDDFGLKPLRSPEDEDFHDLIAERYERTATILTSNLDFDEWGEAFAANKMIGSATLDRLRHGAYRVVLDGDSYRDPKPVLGRSKASAGKGGKPTPA